MVDQIGRWSPDFPGQQPFTDPQFVRIYGQQQPAQTPQQPAAQQQPRAGAPAMTPPTIHAEIIQVSSGEQGELEAAQYPLGAGQSQMFIKRDDSAVLIKTATANGYMLDVFDKRPPAPTPPPFNPDEYVRLDALTELIEARVQAAVAGMQPAKPARAKKETEAAE